MQDDPKHPNFSDGLVPDHDSENDHERLTDDTPDTFDEPMGENKLENELPEEGVYPEDTDFEQALEDDEIDRFGENG